MFVTNNNLHDSEEFENFNLFSISVVNIGIEKQKLVDKSFIQIYLLLML